MAIYAFVDVQNTETTTQKVLGFEIDHEKLYAYLRDTWHCDKVFFYPGIQYGDEQRKNIFKKVTDLGAIVREKYYKVYKDTDTVVEDMCPKCYTKIPRCIRGGVSWKCNCDVEMTMDIVDHIASDATMLVFTGDGDFEPLICKAADIGAKVYLVSCAQMVRSGPRYATSRFSTKLRKLRTTYPQNVFLVEIGTWKVQIQKSTKKGSDTQVGAP